jgi:hypothetical protein
MASGLARTARPGVTTEAKAASVMAAGAKID